MWGRWSCCSAASPQPWSSPHARPSRRVTARAAIIVDAANRRGALGAQRRRPLPPASTTKVLTAILAIESGRPRRLA